MPCGGNSGCPPASSFSIWGPTGFLTPWGRFLRIGGHPRDHRRSSSSLWEKGAEKRRLVQEARRRELSMFIFSTRSRGSR